MGRFSCKKAQCPILNIEVPPVKPKKAVTIGVRNTGGFKPQSS
jgi:hypothetical protein